VLEIGAGTGLNLRHYPSGLDELVLSEPDEGMAWRLRTRVERAGAKAQVVLADAEQLPFADESFDSVVGTLVLCTVTDLERSLAEIHRVLAPGGRLLFVEARPRSGGNAPRTLAGSPA
jgi:ubiquinone/menaquinone biosynthesis C-methylase UbiE